jgi:serine/threonine-protein kinase PknG
MKPCNRPGCTGVVAETGFCDSCGRRPQQPSPRDVGPATTVRGSSGRPTQTGGGSEFQSLPSFEFPDPSSRILSNPEIPERDRRCVCGTDVGRGYLGQPAPGEGFCPKCGRPFSFLPSLRNGDLVAGQYKVIGCFARGGVGWVYLAEDRNLDGNLVVLKGLIDTGDSALAATERRALTMMDHPNIVRIFNFVTHPDPRAGEPREYIVMEYIDGLVLSDVQRQAAEGDTPLGEPLRVEHVIVCGLQILSAFDYLHGRQLLYCDMKPANVIVRSGQRGGRANRVKLIDLGAVRLIGDRTSKVIGTPGYQVGHAEIVDRGLTPRSDIHTVGVTLDHLYRVTADRTEQRAGDNPVAMGLESFGRALARATHPEPDRRFGSAAEMADQLRGVYREIASLRDGKARPEESTVFAPTAMLLDVGLGMAPPLARWIRDGWSGHADAPLPDGRPTPVIAAARLPVPRVDPDDRAAGVLAAADAPSPRRLLDMLSAYEADSAEVQFARCRAHLELGALGPATESVEQAAALLGGAAGYDWRMNWHRGLLSLLRGDIHAATDEFDSVYRELPGEDAPKLALGYCAEHRGDPIRAEKFYQAVWCRDRLQASAAFGLARIRMSRGDRAGAVSLLDGVPKVSRHADAAAIARVHVLTGRLSSGPPAVDDLREVADRLSGTYLDGGDDNGDARERLTTVVREAAFGWACANGFPIPADGGTVLGNQPGEGALRRLLERSYRALARQARDAATHAVFVDLANVIRPTTFL